MRILLINRLLGSMIGGGEAFDLNVADHLQRRGHQVDFLTAKPIRKSPPPLGFCQHAIHCLSVPYLRNVGYTLQRISAKAAAPVNLIDEYIFSQAALLWLRMEKRFRNFDVVQCCSLIPLAKQLSAAGIPTIAWLPGSPSASALKTLRTLETNASFALFTHGATVDDLRRAGLSLKQYAEIAPGVDLTLVNTVGLGARDRLRNSIGVGPDEILGITVARLISVKNVTMLIEAIARARALQMPLHWVIVGDGPLRSSLEECAHRSGLTNFIHFVGKHPPTAVHEWLAAADIFGLTSRFESFSIACLEAMAHGLPIACTDAGYLPTLITDAQCGLIVAQDDCAAFAQALLRLGDPDLRRGLGECGKRYAAGHDWSSTARHVESLYNRILEEKCV